MCIGLKINNQRNHTCCDISDNCHRRWLIFSLCSILWTKTKWAGKNYKDKNDNYQTNLFLFVL